MIANIEKCAGCKYDKNGKPYISMTLRELVYNYPEIAAACHLDEFPLLPVFLSDSDYLVRIKEDKLEIGYKEDAWEIG